MKKNIARALSGYAHGDININAARVEVCQRFLTS